jgi:hypothetical protein
MVFKIGSVKIRIRRLHALLRRKPHDFKYLREPAFCTHKNPNPRCRFGLTLIDQ